MREGLAAAALAHDGPEPIFATASFGITLLDPDISVENYFYRADKAMYAAKTAGRNRTCIWIFLAMKLGDLDSMVSSRQGSMREGVSASFGMPILDYRKALLIWV